MHPPNIDNITVFRKLRNPKDIGATGYNKIVQRVKLLIDLTKCTPHEIILIDIANKVETLISN